MAGDAHGTRTRVAGGPTCAATADYPVNGWLHFGAAVLAAAGLVVLAVQAAERGSLRHVVGACVFGAGALLMFAASALYHLSKQSPRCALYRRLDHAMIFVCIAGTCTPVCLIALRGTGLGTGLLVTVWSLAVVGIVLKLRWHSAPRLLSTGLYLGLGWMCALSGPALLRTAPELFGWLLTGGLLYTIGAIVYQTRWPRGRPGVFGAHELWHLFVIAAIASHYWAVYAHLLPRG